MPKSKKTSKKNKIREQKRIESIDALNALAREQYGLPECGEGQVLREGYYKKGSVRKSHKLSSGKVIGATQVSPTWVPPTCIKSRAKTNRSQGKKLFTLQKDVLKKYGYENIKEMTETARHTALKKALNDGTKPLALFRRLIALSVLNEHKDPVLSQLFKDDADWVQTTEEYKARGGKRTNKKISKKISKKVSKKVSKKRSQKSSYKGSRKMSHKRSKKGSR